ncbi:MucR family transcriptional regulator [Methylobacterium sp. D53M]
MNTEHPHTNVELAAGIVSAYVSNNSIAATDLPGLLNGIHAALRCLDGGLGAPATESIKRPTPAQIRKSIRPDGLVSFIDGKSYKTLKRHLTKHGLDARGYRERYGLPEDYPVVAAAYSEQRSSLAKAIGLGVPGAAASGARNRAGSKQAA